MKNLPILADYDDKSSPLKNRIRKNYRHVRKWANRTKTNCFRIYDRDIRDYPFAIDYYDGRFCVHVFTNEHDPREKEVQEALSSLFESDAIYWRTRIKRAKTQQYERQELSKDFFIIQEYGVKFWVNLRDYLDTGLFLDHRETRRLVATMASGKRLLNLFAYTGSFSVHAALQGATFTKTVDMSNTYCAWAAQNFHLNKLSMKSNVIERADCLKFLENERQTYDLIVIDPPTLSRSKKMSQMFDIQKDYPLLIDKALRLLAPQGTLFFSTNSRKFVFDSSLFPSYAIHDISAKTIPLDFHDLKTHRCWLIKSSPLAIP